jgi:hypothetical protein
MLSTAIRHESAAWGGLMRTAGNGQLPSFTPSTVSDLYQPLPVLHWYVSVSGWVRTFEISA